MFSVTAPKNAYLNVLLFCILSGTFAEENEQVVYGLVYPVKSFDILLVQVSRNDLKVGTVIVLPPDWFQSRDAEQNA